MSIHVRDVLQGRFDPKKSLPMTKWISEIARLTAERKLIEADYYKLRDEYKKRSKSENHLQHCASGTTEDTAAKGAWDGNLIKFVAGVNAPGHPTYLQCKWYQV